jgi:hypothetical protein
MLQHHYPSESLFGKFRSSDSWIVVSTIVEVKFAGEPESDSARGYDMYGATESKDPNIEFIPFYWNKQMYYYKLTTIL